MSCLSTDKKQKENAKRVMKIVNTIDKHPLAKALGATDMETFNWLWKEYNRDSPHYDPSTVRITDGQVRVFESGVKEWLKSLTKRSGFFGRNFKLPKALVGGIRGGEEFIRRIGEAVSYNQRQMKEGSKQIQEMQDGLMNMFFDKESTIIAEARVGWSKGEYERFQSLERRLMLAKPNSKEYTDTYKELIDIVGSGTEGDPLGGKILRRYQKILSMEIPTSEMTPNEQNIAQHWNVLRTDSMKNLLNAAISARRTIETLQDGPNKSHLVKAHDMINKQIDAL